MLPSASNILYVYSCTLAACLGVQSTPTAIHQRFEVGAEWGMFAQSEILDVQYTYLEWRSKTNEQRGMKCEYSFLSSS